jgi:beta-galactosidase
MFHGGTNFGFTNGANDKGNYRATITSYDYDAPLDEAGDATPKYEAFRSVIARHSAAPAEPVPAPSPKFALSGIELTEQAPLFADLDALGDPVEGDRPLTMEELGQSFGFVLYTTRLETPGPTRLAVGAVRDRAQVFLDGQPVGVLERENHEHTLTFTVPSGGAELRVLVENQGRVNYGVALHDRKGLIGPVTLNGRAADRWSSLPLPLEDLSPFSFVRTGAPVPGPVLHRGTFHADQAADTHLHLDGWTKGNAWINGFNLGRYWSRGPQLSLYVPAPVLRPGANEIVLLELHGSTGRTVDLRETPDLGPTEE